LLRTEPLRAMVIGAFVRGLSMRDVESLCEKAGLGKLPKSTAAKICQELRERFEQFERRDLYDIRLVALFLDATFLAVPPDGPKEGGLIAWGFTEPGERVLLQVMLGMRESYEDWQALARDLITRGVGAPMLIVADGAPGRSTRSSSAGPPQIASTAACTGSATRWPSSPSANASASARPTGRRSTTPSTNATANNDNKP
jgi:transposase-like protein